MENTPVKRKCAEWDANDSFKCGVCSEFLLPPVQQCIKAHILCNSCCNNLVRNICPICRVDFKDKVHNRLMDRVLGCYYVPCKFSGCNRMFSLVNIERHFRECSYNDEIKCPVLWGDSNIRGDICQDVYSFSKLDAHLNSVHKLSKLECSNPVSIKYCLDDSNYLRNFNQVLVESKYLVVDNRKVLCAVLKESDHIVIRVVPLEFNEKVIIRLSMSFKEHCCNMEKNTSGLGSIFNFADFLIPYSTCDLYSTRDSLTFSVHLLKNKY